MYCVLRNMLYNIVMIKSFKNKGLRKFFENGSAAGTQPGHRQKLRIRLTALDALTCIEDMKTPAWRLHPIKGDRAELWALDLSKNWTIVIKFTDGNAYIVHCEDYP